MECGMEGFDVIVYPASKLSNDLMEIQKWAYKRKLSLIHTNLDNLTMLYSAEKLKILFTLISILITS